MENPVVYLGTIGQGIWKSTDGGDTWNRQANGLFAEADIRAIAVRPDNTNILFAGTEKGLYRSDSAGQSWYQVDSPMVGSVVSSLPHPQGQEPAEREGCVQ